jgi:hypothetical protein
MMRAELSRIRPIARLRASDLENTGRSTTCSSFGSHCITSSPNLAFIFFSSGSSKPTFSEIGFCVLRSQPLTVIDLNCPAVVRLGLKLTRVRPQSSAKLTGRRASAARPKRIFRSALVAPTSCTS